MPWKQVGDKTASTWAPQTETCENVLSRKTIGIEKIGSHPIDTTPKMQFVSVFFSPDNSMHETKDIGSTVNRENSNQMALCATQYSPSYGGMGTIVSGYGPYAALKLGDGVLGVGTSGESTLYLLPLARLLSWSPPWLFAGSCPIPLQVALWPVWLDLARNNEMLGGMGAGRNPNQPPPFGSVPWPRLAEPRSGKITRGTPSKREGSGTPPPYLNKVVGFFPRGGGPRPKMRELWDTHPSTNQKRSSQTSLAVGEEEFPVGGMTTATILHSPWFFGTVRHFCTFNLDHGKN